MAGLFKSWEEADAELADAVQQQYAADRDARAWERAVQEAALAQFFGPRRESDAARAAWEAAWARSRTQQAWAAVRWSHERDREQAEEG